MERYVSYDDDNSLHTSHSGQSSKENIGVFIISKITKATAINYIAEIMDDTKDGYFAH